MKRVLILLALVLAVGMASAISVERTIPNCAINQSCTISLDVKASGASELVVGEKIPKDWEFVSSSPEVFSSANGRMAWVFGGELGQKDIPSLITYIIIPKSSGEISGGWVSGEQEGVTSNKCLDCEQGAVSGSSSGGSSGGGSSGGGSSESSEIKEIIGIPNDTENKAESKASGDIEEKKKSESILSNISYEKSKLWIVIVIGIAVIALIVIILFFVFRKKAKKTGKNKTKKRK